MFKTVNEKLEAMRAQLECGPDCGETIPTAALKKGSTPEYTKAIKASGSPKEVPTASVKKGSTPEYTKVIKASGTAKTIPTAPLKKGSTPKYESDTMREMHRILGVLDARWDGTELE
jgi:hypothetical protein